MYSLFMHGMQASLRCSTLFFPGGILLGKVIFTSSVHKYIGGIMVSSVISVTSSADVHMRIYFDV